MNSVLRYVKYSSKPIVAYSVLDNVGARCWVIVKDGIWEGVWDSVGNSIWDALRNIKYG